MGSYSIFHFLILFLSGMRNDVFLSFNYNETGKKFSDHLHSAISGAGFRTFIGTTNGNIHLETIKREIEKSRASVVIFSNDFASSSRCLDELVTMMEARNKSGLIVLPIYYHASPSGLRWLKGRYGEAFAEHEKRYAEEMERVDRWKAALTEVSYLQGMILRRSFEEHPSSTSALLCDQPPAEVDKANIVMDGNVMRHLRNHNDESWVCQFCDHPFPWEVVPETIRHHLTRVCQSAPENVKEAAQRREVEPAECSRVEDNWESTRILDAHDEHNDNNFEAEVSSVQRTQREGIVQSNKRQRTILDGLPIVAEVEVPMVEGIQDTGESASLTKRPVGNAFERNVEKIWSWLMDDQVIRVGIYGMGGVGKTTLMRHIHNLLEGKRSFQVYWVTVSQDSSIWKLQDLIARQINLNFSDEEDEIKRAKKLAQALQAKGKCVLILDDLWNYFDLDEMGIPVKVNACKFVLTTRLLKVCRQMGCSEENTVQLQRLSEEEAWILFTQELGNYSTKVEELAKVVSRECAGLPLGIRVMARTMKGICNVHIWRNTLEELKESKVSKGHEMREEVFSVLKFSYLRLNDPALQECLLYCALFPEDYKIKRGELIEYMIIEGIIDEKKSRQAELDKGHTMLDALENACLLEGGTELVWMHDLIRDMLIHELREGSSTLVEAGAQLTELPSVERWTENLVRVSLMCNDIAVIPYSHTPRSPNLSALLLRESRGLKMIADSFFEQFQRLEVLDLSLCPEIEELPGSISNLVNLTALLLFECNSLIHVPSLAKLEKLKKLDLSHCEGLKDMPEGMEFLLSLKYFCVSGSRIQEIGSGVIPKLSRLQVLSLCEIVPSYFSVRGREVGELRMLETLHCTFDNIKELGEYIESRERSQQSLKDYAFYIGKGPGLYEERFWWFRTFKKIIVLTDFSFSGPLRLPTDIEALHIERCDSKCLSFSGTNLLSCLIKLQVICVYKSDAIEEIFATRNRGGDTKEQENRGDDINIAIEEIFAIVPFPLSNDSTHSLSNHSLLNLKFIVIERCPKLKKLFPPNLLPNLHNLQEISVSDCDGMEEMFSTDQALVFGQNINNNHYPPDPTSSIGLNLPRLTRLKLWCLPQLRSIYKGAIICHSLQQIVLVSCPKLERITLPLPQPSLRDIRVYPKEWWELVQWGNANDKIHLQSLTEFRVERSESIPYWSSMFERTPS